MAMDESHNEDDDLGTCVVLGGRSFIGRSLVLKLLKLGKWIVRVVDSTHSPQLAPDDSALSKALSSGLASYLHVDIRNKFQIANAVRGASVVFYFDSMDINTKDFYTCYKVIVEGAKNVINACRDQKVQHLIYNSSADVVFDTRREIRDGDESLPYAGKQGDMLADLKAQAEAFILFANDLDGLLTCSLRPANVFGPGDTDLVPSIIRMAKSGWSKFIIGRKDIMSDFTFVENVAHAHICAEAALSSPRIGSASGKAFFITNFEHISVSEFISLLLDGLGFNRPMIKLPSWMAQYFLLLVKSMNSNMDFGYVQKVLDLGSCTRTFNYSAAERHIGYSPIVSLEEGIVATIQSLPQLSTSSSSVSYPDFDEQPKVEILLGNGIVADILLWRDQKKTFACFVFSLVLYYWFFLCGRTFISSVAKLLMFFALFLFAYGVLPSRLYNFVIPRVSPSGLEISEVCASDAISFVAQTCSNVGNIIKTLGQGEDWLTFFKVAGLLYFMKVITANSLITAAVGIALVLVFMIFLVYEQLQGEIDGTAALTLSISQTAFRFLIKNLPASFSPLRQISEDGGYPTSKRLR